MASFYHFLNVDISPSIKIITMNKNEGVLDRVLRGVVALGAAIAAMSTAGVMSIIFWIVAGLMAVTAAVGFCPLYKLIGVNTCPVKR